MSKKPKYGNQKVCVNGETFDSKMEYHRYCQLLALEKAGKISDLQKQVKYSLIPTQRKPSGGVERGISYIADFVYTQNGKTIVEDVKGYRNPQSSGYAKFVIKRKLMLYLHGIEIREV